MAKYYLEEQMRLHPSMQPKDAVKLCFQAAFGAEHLLEDIERAKQYFDREFKSIDAKEGVLTEFIADDVCRVNLAVWKAMGLPKDELFQLFVTSAKQERKDGTEVFWHYMEEAGKLSWQGQKWHDFVEEYLKDGIRAVHHSENYRKHESPAYRIISGYEYTNKFKENEYEKF